MRAIRTVTGIAVVGAMAALTVGITPAAAQTMLPTGAGTAEGSGSVLEVAVGRDGRLLTVDLLEDRSFATIDRGRRAEPESVLSISPARAVSAEIDGLAAEVPTVSVRSTGAESRQSLDDVDLATAFTSGSVTPLALSALVDADGARGGLTSQLRDLAVATGLAGLDAADAALTVDAGGLETEARRGVSVDSLDVLDLGALLAGLGLPLPELPVDTLIALLGQLDLALADVQGATLGSAEVAAAVAALDAAIADTKAAVDEATAVAGADPLDCAALDATLTGLGLDTVDDTTGVGDVVGGVPGLGDTLAGGTGTCDADTLAEVIAALDAALTALRAQLVALLGDLLAVLDGATLMSVSDVVLGLAAVAGPTEAASTATAAASIGSVRVGNVDLGGVDLAATLAQVTALATTVSETVNGVLAVVHPDLANVVGVTLNDTTTSIETDGNYVVALASGSVATVTITPPPVLAELISTLTSGDAINDAIDLLGGTVPALDPVLSLVPTVPVTTPTVPTTPDVTTPTVPAVPASANAAGIDPTTLAGSLAEGATVKVLSGAVAADFTTTPLAAPGAVPGADTPAPLANTGSESSIALAAAALLLALAVGMRMVARREEA